MAKNKKRTLYLVKLDIYSSWQRLRYDFVNEIVVIISAAVLLGLFYYMFNDFINGKLAAISPQAREVAAFVTGMMMIIGGILISTYRLATSAAGNIGGHWAVRMGERRSIASAARSISLISKSLIVAALIYFLVARLFGSDRRFLDATLSAYAASLILGLWRLTRPATATRKLKSPEWDFETKSPGKAMAHWRLWQIRYTSALAGYLALFYVIGLCLLAAAFLTGTPPSVLALSAMTIGTLAAASMSYQFAEDATLFWAERTMSVAHEDIIKAYQRISWLFAGIALAIALLLLVITLSRTGLSTTSAMQILTPFVIAITPALITPSLIFQLDPRRPWLQVAANLLITLFIGTGIFISIFAAVLIPLFVYYAKQTQQNRFYRA